MQCRCKADNPESATYCNRCGRSLAAPDRARLWRDIAAAASLLVALAAVYGVDRCAASRPVSAGGVAQLGEARTLRLAVTSPEYDDMGKLLSTLGAGYPFVETPMESLLEAEALRGYDVVFLTCGGVPPEWLGRRTGDAQRGAVGAYRPRPRIAARLKQALRGYVAGGGTLYVSDWQFQLLDLAFPEFIDPARRFKGDVQTVRADVVDPGLARRLGPTIELRFERPAWFPAAFRDAGVTRYLAGACRTIDGRQVRGSLLASFPFENGTVVYTSFHNETQNSQVEMELLRYLVFTTVTAREDAQVQRTMIRGGFSPTQRNLLSASQDTAPIQQEFVCRTRGPLRFALGFEEQGARLRLAVVGPDGSSREQSGDKTFAIEIPDAAVGAWRYTITPEHVPFANCPFTLTIGEKGPPAP
jgi:hypothetical protein